MVFGNASPFWFNYRFFTVLIANNYIFVSVTFQLSSYYHDCLD